MNRRYGRVFWSPDTGGQQASSEGQEPHDEGQVPSVESGGVGETVVGQEPKTFDEAYVRKLRAESARYRTQMSKLEEQLKGLNDAQLSEKERLQKRVAELERQHVDEERERQERTLRYEAMLMAGKLGLVDPDAAYRLLDLTAIEYDDNGKPSNLEQAMNDLVKQRPYLKAAGATSATNPPRDRQTLTLEAIQKMTPDQINANWEAVQAVLQRK